MVRSDRAKLDSFKKLRNHYIDLLDQGKISKDQFNQKNSQLFARLGLKPFSVLDSFEKALFNYNFYNCKAKESLKLSNWYRENKKPRKCKREENAKLNYYIEKDKATMAMIRLEEDQYLDAYYINLHSKKLSKEIYEINFLRRDKVILHSKNLDILKELMERRVFSEGMRESLIDEYVNNG